MPYGLPVAAYGANGIGGDLRLAQQLVDTDACQLGPALLGQGGTSQFVRATGA